MDQRKTMAKGALWLAVLVGIGLVIGVVADGMIKKATHLVPVWVAAKEVPVDHVLEIGDIKKELRPEMSIPKTAIRDPAEVVGRYTITRILPGQIIERGMVSSATTVREVVREFGEDYVGMAVQIEPQDMPISAIRPGDLVALIGTFQDQKKITTKLLATRVPVLSVDERDRKIIVAVPRLNALMLARDKASGRISVVLDPLPYEAGKRDPIVIYEQDGFFFERVPDMQPATEQTAPPVGLPEKAEAPNMPGGGR